MSSLLRRVSMVALAMGLAAGHDSTATAQAGRRPVRRYQGVSQPLISPYFGLTQPSGSTGLNYFNLVQPQLQAQQNTQFQSRQIQGLNRQLLQDERQGPFGSLTQIGATGARGAATYQNYSHYYPSMGGPGGGGGAPPRKRASGGGSGGMFGGMGMGMGGGF